ncbi:hypothetical protein ABW20_dc0104511 [Dactylellina cionopaga]|nr:hypothetical protein ABW20_dc0104511 [Dactylellina cionopaga]
MRVSHILPMLVVLAANATSLPTIPSIQTRASALATGSSLKEEFVSFAETLDEPRKKFITNVPLSVWDQLAVLQNAVDASFDSGKPDEAIVHQLSYAKGSIYECTIPDFASLPTTLAKPPNNCPST